MTLGAKSFDRTIGGEGGLLINRGKVGKEKDRGRKRKTQRSGETIYPRTYQTASLYSNGEN